MARLSVIIGVLADDSVGGKSMTLQSARFRGDPVLERIATGDKTAYLRFGAQGEHVRAVQFGLIDQGFEIPDGATGNFLTQTSAAVVEYKTLRELHPNDPVVGIGTMTALDQDWALPFATRDEWLSWQTRPIPDFNFTRQDELFRQSVGAQFTFSPLSAWVPGPFKNALLTGITALLDPTGSPLGAFTPSATWGVSPLDLYHCHVVIDNVNVAPSWSQLKVKENAIHQRMLTMMSLADLKGPEGLPPWTAEYRRQILAPAQPGKPSFIDQFAELLNGLLANAAAEQQTLKLVWHTFEHAPWRPVEVGSGDPRRAWWNDVAPTPSGLTQWPFPVTPDSFGNNVFQLVELAFLIDRDRVVTVLGETRTEAAALVSLDKARMDAASAGLPFP